MIGLNMVFYKKFPVRVDFESLLAHSKVLPGLQLSWEMLAEGFRFTPYLHYI
jgi:hypothetical protein